MRRTSISLPDDVAAALTREAHRSGRSASQVARDALVSYLGLRGGKPRDLPFAAVGRSGKHNTARDMEELLAREWSDDALNR